MVKMEKGLKHKTTWISVCLCVCVSVYVSLQHLDFPQLEISLSVQHKKQPCTKRTGGSCRLFWLFTLLKAIKNKPFGNDPLITVIYM